MLLETDIGSVEARQSHHHRERRAGGGVMALLSYRTDGEARRFRDRWDGQELRWRQRQQWQQEHQQPVRPKHVVPYNK